MYDEIRIGEDILTSKLDSKTGSITFQLGSVSDDVVSSEGVEVWQQIGFASRPSKSKPGESAGQAIVITSSGYDIAIASRDVRAHKIYGELKQGETCMYATGVDGNSQGRIIIKDDGSMNFITTSDNTPDGTNTVMRAAPKEFRYQNEFGAFIFNEDGFQIVHNNGTALIMNSQGITLIGNQIKLAGGGVLLGTAATAATPVTIAGTSVSSSVFASL